MSTTALDPTVVSRLRQFGQRRFRLLAARGLCAGIVTFLLCLTVVAAIDWYWVLSDTVRWSLSGAAYALTFIAVWMLSLRKLVRTPAREELAAYVEDMQPELRENLLSAVELATDDPASVTDSPVFRGLLQSQVGQQMLGVRVSRLLPLRLMSRWFLAATFVLLVVIGLLSLPDSRFRLLAARALMPGANIQRISRVNVEILEPTPNSLTIARGETVAIIVNVSGGAFGDVVLETFTAEGTQQQVMRGRTESEFAANIPVTTTQLQYRILAGDAITMRHTIEAKGRPQVVQFHKTLNYPDYSGLQTQTLTEDHGDLLALTGTTAELALELDQDVAEAELRVDVAGSEHITTIPLIQNSAGLWTAQVPIEEAAIYKVHLVSAETGFENIFSPRYEIRPFPDQRPRVGFVDLLDTTVLLPANDILSLKGLAEDDLPLVSLEQQYSVNGQDWLSRALDTEVAGPAGTDSADANSGLLTYSDSLDHRLTCAWQWDLLELQLQAGDQVLTRLVATDRLGNQGESVPLRIVVASVEFDPQRHLVMQHKAALYDDVAKLQKQTEEHTTAALEIIQRLQQEAAGKLEEARAPEQRDLDYMSLLDLAGKIRTASGEVLTQVQTVIQKMPAAADAYDVDLVGQIVSRIHHEHSQTPTAVVRRLQENGGDVQDANRQRDELKRTFDRLRDDANSLRHHFQNLVTHNIVAGVAGDFHTLLAQQELVASSPDQTWARLLRHETIVLNQLDELERLMHEQQDRVPDHIRNQLRALIDWTAQRREQLEHTMEAEDQLPELQKLAANLLRELKDRQRVDVLDGGLSERLNQARRDFQNRAGTLSDPIRRIADLVHEENRLTTQAGAASDSATADRFLAEAKRESLELDFRQIPALEQLRERRILTQYRADGNQQFAADAGLAHRATLSVFAGHREGDLQQSEVATALREIAPAWRILEAGHDMRNVQLCLNALIQAERWKSQQVVGRTDHPRQWDVVQKGLEEAINALRRASVDGALMSRFDQVRWSPSVEQAHRKLSQRRWSRDAMVPADSDLSELERQLQQVSEDLNPIMAEARATIAKYAPTVPQMAEQIAKQVRQLEADTTALADSQEQASQPANEAEAAADAAKDSVAPEDSDATKSADATEAAPPTMADLQQQKQKINEQLDDLFEALIEDANQQDLLDENQRERARDADDSIAMIRQPAQQMNQAMQQAQQTPASEKQAQKLAQAAEHQEQTAQALDKVAGHFERLEQGADVAESREQLRQFEREQGIAQQKDQNFQNAQQLAQSAQQNPADLLAQLEQKLQHNPAMQQALSEISQSTLQAAQSALQDAAQQEQEIQRSNERSDSDFQQQKKQLADQLKELGRDASALSRQLVAQAGSAASQAKTPEAQQKFSETQKQLNTAANQASSANEGELQQDLVNKLQQTQQALQAASEALAEARKESADAKGQGIHDQDRKRQDAKKKLEAGRKRFLDQMKKAADAEKRKQEGQLRRAEQQTKAAVSSVQQAERRLRDANRNLQQKPEDSGRKRAVAQAEATEKSANSKLQAAEKQQQQAELKVEKARQDLDVAKRIPTPALGDKNPAAQLAEEYAKSAQEQTADLQKGIQQIAKQSDFQDQLKPTEQQLAQATRKQDQVQDQVQETSQDLARASRHERRLQNAVASEALQQASQDVQQVADQEAQTAQARLQTAQAKAAADPANADPSSDGQPAKAALVEAGSDSESALAAQAALKTSEQALAAQSEELTDMLNAISDSAAEADAGPSQQQQNAVAMPTPNNDAAAQPDASGAPQTAAAAANPATQPSSAGQPAAVPVLTPEQLQTGRQLAQTLDELDRQAAAAQAASVAGAAQPADGTAQAQSSPQQALTPGQRQAQQAQQAQMAAARASAQQQAALSPASQGSQSEGDPAYDGQTDAFVVVPLNRKDDEEWGKLREQLAEDASSGRRETVSEEYRRSVEAYFRVLAERAQKKK